MTEATDDIPLEPWAHGMEHRDVLFVREFLVDMNQKRAAIVSGICSSEENAHRNAYRILRRTVILKAIAAAMEERATALKISAKTVLYEAWRCYMECVGERNWKDARGFLELAGRHTDVRAFRDKFGRGNAMDDDEDEAAEAGLSNLSLEELEELERLSRKAAGLNENEGSPSPLRH